MNLDGDEKLAQRARVFKAMGHPTRLFIVEELARGERCVCDLTALIDADVSTVSRHLAVLRNAGVVADDKRGARVYYRLLTPCLAGLFACMNPVLSGAADGRAGGS